MRNIFVVLFIFLLFSCKTDEKKEMPETPSINFSTTIMRENNSMFVVNYFSDFKPDEFFNQSVERHMTHNSLYNNVDKDYIMNLELSDLQVLSSLSDGYDTIVFIDWQEPLYRWQGNNLTLPIIRFVPETGEYFYSKIIMGQNNKLNAWWIMVKD